MAVLAIAVAACSAPEAQQSAPAKAAEKLTDLANPWKTRLDDPSAKPDAGMLAVEKDAVTITSGPAGFYYKPDMKAEKDYSASGVFSQLKATPQPVEYGLFVAGSNLDKDTAHYTALLVRADGKYQIASWDGGKATVIVPWTTAAAMMEPKGAKTSNTLIIRGLQGAVHFLINEKEVHQMPRARAGEDGVAGIRVGQGLNIQVSKLEVKKFP
jgi:hypothetical protein